MDSRVAYLILNTNAQGGNKVQNDYFQYKHHGQGHKITMVPFERVSYHKLSIHSNYLCLLS